MNSGLSPAVILAELKGGFASYRRSIATFVVIALLIGVGSAAASVGFQVYQAVLIRRLPVKDPSNLFQLFERRPRLAPRSIFPDEVYRNLTAVPAFDQVFAQADQAVLFRSSTRSERIFVQGVTGNYFAALGLVPYHGRLLGSGERNSAVLSYAFWKRAFDEDPSVLGKTVVIDSRAFPVIGITPPGFNGTDVDRGPDIRISMEDLVEVSPRDEEPPWVEIIGRLARGHSVRQAQEQVSAIVCRTVEDGGADSVFELEAIARGTSRVRSELGGTISVLFGATGLLFVVVSTNIAGILVLRATVRQRDTAIRLSLGATRLRIALSGFVEGVAPALAGLGLSVGLAYLAVPAVRNSIPPVRSRYAEVLPVSLDIHFDLYGATFAALACLGAGFIAALAPAILSTFVDITSRLRTTAEDRRWRRTQEIFVSAQIAVTVFLLVAAGSALVSFQRTRLVRTGIDVPHIATVSLNTSLNHYTSEQTRQFQQHLLDGIRRIPGVQAAGLSAMPVLRGVGMSITVAQPGVESPTWSGPNSNMNVVGAGYLEALGLPLISGRTVQDRDGGSKPVPVVVNQTFARTFVPGTNPLGWRFDTGRRFVKPKFEIVGIVGDSRVRSPLEAIPPMFYTPGFESAVPPDSFVVTVRANNPSAVLNSLRGMIQSLDPGMPAIHASTLERDVDSSLSPQRFLAVLMSGFAILSIVLSIVGLYNVVARFVTGAQREISVRMAIGAASRDIVLLISRRVVRIVVSGGVAGVAIALYSSAGLPGAFMNLTVEPAVLIVAVLILVLSTALAAVGPVRRAVGLHPASLLRQQ